MGVDFVEQVVDHHGAAEGEIAPAGTADDDIEDAGIAGGVDVDAAVLRDEIGTAANVGEDVAIDGVEDQGGARWLTLWS